MEIPSVSLLLKDQEATTPAWVARNAAAGKILAMPTKEYVTEAISEQDIIEFYSR